MAMSRDEIEKMWNAMDAHLQGQPSPEPGESAASGFGLPYNSPVYPEQAGGHQHRRGPEQYKYQRYFALCLDCDAEHSRDWWDGWEARGVADDDNKAAI